MPKRINIYMSDKDYEIYLKLREIIGKIVEQKPNVNISVSLLIRLYIRRLYEALKENLNNIFEKGNITINIGRVEMNLNDIVFEQPITGSGEKVDITDFVIQAQIRAWKRRFNEIQTVYPKKSRHKSLIKLREEILGDVKKAKKVSKGLLDKITALLGEIETEIEKYAPKVLNPQYDFT